MTKLEIIHPDKKPRGIRAAVFDFDGTVSTLRCGWEQVMRPLMLEVISGKTEEDAPMELQKEVDAYIDASTGIQTIYQMQWLRDRAYQAGFGSPEKDEWWYKDEYNRRLMEFIGDRIKSVESGAVAPETYIIKGSVEFLTAFKNAGVEVYLASGTDHKDVVHEATALGVKDLFTQIKGAPEHMAACSKEAVIRMIIEEKGLHGDEMLLCGDGKVEIRLGAEAGAVTLGAATDEVHRAGINPVKRRRLINAGADAITGDFENYAEIMNYLGF